MQGDGSIGQCTASTHHTRLHWVWRQVVDHYGGPAAALDHQRVLTRHPVTKGSLLSASSPPLRP
eukprot:362422-Chlamydomonas_euryale.AAC.1